MQTSTPTDRAETCRSIIQQTKCAKGCSLLNLEIGFGDVIRKRKQIHRVLLRQTKNTGVDIGRLNLPNLIFFSHDSESPNRKEKALMLATKGVRIHCSN